MSQTMPVCSPCGVRLPVDVERRGHRLVGVGAHGAERPQRPRPQSPTWCRPRRRRPRRGPASRRRGGRLRAGRRSVAGDVCGGALRRARRGSRGLRPVASRVTSELPSTSGIASRAAGRSGGTVPATSMVATAAAPPAKIRFCMCSTLSPASRSSSSTRASTPTLSRWRTVRVALPRPRGARLTQLRASPAANASTISTTPAAMAAWACAVEAPMWWVATTRGCRASGESHSAVPEPGSSANTSRPARTRPASSAASSAASSTTSPREVFTQDRARASSRPGSRRPRGSWSPGDAGTCRLTTSEAASSSGSEA